MANKEVIAAIDLEIARLKQAREMLTRDEDEAPRKQGSKKEPAKKRVERTAGTKRVLSAEARSRIAEAQKKRWAAHAATNGRQKKQS